MNKNFVNEIFWIRATCCLAVVLIHTLYAGSMKFYYSPNQDAGLEESILYLLRLPLLFATPVFVFISEFLLGRSYSKGLPKNFFKKRVKFILIPYIFMCILYAYLKQIEWTVTNFITTSIRNILLGEATVYFVLIIFQFYILHLIFCKALDNWKPKIVLIISFIINIVYLGIFNFTEVPEGFVGNYIWTRGYYILFIGWIFYFALGYYFGKYYELFLNKINEHIKLIVFLTICSITFIVINRYFGIIVGATSKNLDNVIYTTLIIFLMFFIYSKFKKVPKIILFISNYSFSIYLLHQAFIQLLGKWLNTNIITYIILVFSFSIIASITTTYLFNKVKFGKYLVGQPYKIKRL